MTDKIPIAIRQQIIEGEIQRWDNTTYLWEVRAWVASRVGEDMAVMKAELEKCKRSLDALQEKLAEVEGIDVTP